MHMRTHTACTGEKPYSCDVCAASFNFKLSGALRNHMRTHTGEKPFSCNLWSAAFTESSSLKRHMMTHTGEKPYTKYSVSWYTCLCFTFSRNENLKIHMRTHTGEKTYSCDVCNCIVYTKEGLEKSWRKTLHMCDVCGAAFAHLSSLKYHVTTHTRESPRPWFLRRGITHTSLHSRNSSEFGSVINCSLKYNIL